MKNLVFVGIITIILALMGLQFWRAMGDGSRLYKADIKRFRLKKDQYMLENDMSPISTRAKRNRLSYFPVDPDYRVEASVDRLDSIQKVVLDFTQGRSDTFLLYGYAAFNLEGQDLKLKLYTNPRDTVPEKLLFAPFGDDTNGMETFSAGRYLDVTMAEPKATKVWLDFNLAYNPYYAYNSEYVCPIVPKSNRLPIRIEAGELKYQ